MLLKSTTRHVHLFAGTIQDDAIVPCGDRLTLTLDPDSEFLWNDAAVQRVRAEFERLVAASNGAELTEYNLRRIGSDLEHFIRGLLNEGAIAYNLETRALNYSMGLPRVAQD